MIEEAFRKGGAAQEPMKRRGLKPGGGDTRVSFQVRAFAQDLDALMRGIVPRALVLVAALYVVHLYWSLRTLREGLTFASIWRLQMRYRALYAIIGLIIVVSVLE